MISSYRKINQALAKEFGKGQVVLRKAKDGQGWEYAIWFQEKPSISVLEKAKQIVESFEPTKWFDELIYQGEDNGNS